MNPLRTTWEDIPEGVRRVFEKEVGGAVVAASSQDGGFSSGGADRLLLADGRRLFAKSISRQRNPSTFELHRREASVVRELPASVPAPRLVTVVEQDEWLVVAFGDVDGRQPRIEDTPAVLDMLGTLPPADGLTGFPRLTDELTPDASSWKRLVESGVVTRLDPWATTNIDRLASAAAILPEVVDGDHLVHLDCRADNILIDEEARVWLVDWPWASIGAPWFDAVKYLLDVLVRNPDTNPQLLLEHPVFRGASAPAVDAVLAGLAASWTERLEEPAPEDMPTLRDSSGRKQPRPFAGFGSAGLDRMTTGANDSPVTATSYLGAQCAVDRVRACRPDAAFSSSRDAAWVPSRRSCCSPPSRRCAAARS